MSQVDQTHSNSTAATQASTKPAVTIGITLKSEHFQRIAIVGGGLGAVVWFQQFQTLALLSDTGASKEIDGGVFTQILLSACAFFFAKLIPAAHTMTRAGYLIMGVMFAILAALAFGLWVYQWFGAVGDTP